MSQTALAHRSSHPHHCSVESFLVGILMFFNIVLQIAKQARLSVQYIHTCESPKSGLYQRV